MPLFRATLAAVLLLSALGCGQSETAAPTTAVAEPLATPAAAPTITSTVAATDTVSTYIPPTLQPVPTATVDTIMRRTTTEPMIPQVSSPTWPPRVTVEQARQMVEAGQAVIVDVRAAEYFDKRHIPGSVNIPLPDISARVDELPQGKRLLTVCT
jgi:hypothetical protein